MEKSGAHLILGGCRSGKSRHALLLAEQWGDAPHVFMATCIPSDEEMQARVLRHQQERGPKWKTVEAPLALAGALREHGPAAGVIIVDCLTLWISNLMARHQEDARVMEHARDLAEALDAAACPVFLVSNEVGAGIVPENPMARRFRDLAGFVNQHMAARAKRVTWMVAGIPVRVK